MAAPTELENGSAMDATLRWLRRYQPFILTVTCIALIAFLLPGENNSVTTEAGSSQLSTGVGREAAGIVPEEAAQLAQSGGGNGGSASAQAPTEVLSFDEARKQGVPLVANCDNNSGRIKIPSWGSPVCVSRFSGQNAGSSWQGVTKDKIKVALYHAQEDAAANAILAAAGASDTPEQEDEQAREWARLFEKHYNTWGRKAEVVVVNGSGAPTDDAAAKADAIKVATEIKAFVSWNSPNNTYVNELVARGVMCMCTVELPNAFYQKWAPHVWSTLQSADQTYQLLTEYIVKRLANRKAKWAGDPAFQQRNRVFGLLQYDTRDFAYKSASTYLTKELAKHGIKLVVAYFNGYPELAANQEQARPVIQRMKEAGVTSLICGCDPFAPIFFTQEATRQLYQPEWINVGSALTDTSFFGRTYDQDQWEHNFGLGQLVARLPEKLSDSYRLYTWHYGREPTAPAGYGVIRAPIDIFYRGVHMAGPKLTPQTFQAGMFSHPLIGQNMKTVPSISWGKKVWPFNDYTSYDDVVEIWWDRNARGEDEIGADGIGMYRYVDGGKRILPGQFPRTEPRVFDPRGTVTVHQNYPPGEAPPQYPRPS
ncbi:MAG TPA: hypothetical protein VFA34_11000 [Actinomycetota bacterium]|jgi:hypothetical protein|nr:hypothetical protein [Actinomycetota bacterium]